VFAIFVDAGAWVGLLAASDQHHRAATKAYAQLKEEGRRLFTSEPVIVEAVTHLRIRSTAEHGADAWERLMVRGLATPLAVRPSIISKA